MMADIRKIKTTTLLMMLMRRPIMILLSLFVINILSRTTATFGLIIQGNNNIIANNNRPSTQSLFPKHRHVILSNNKEQQLYSPWRAIRQQQHQQNNSDEEGENKRTINNDKNQDQETTNCIIHQISRGGGGGGDTEEGEDKGEDDRAIIVAGQQQQEESNSSSTNKSNTTNSSSSSSSSSKRDMLLFALPALGIFLANPLLSNIDNAFVGRTVGTVGLAALSPATICTDQMLYLFSFLSRATTGLVASAYGNDGNGNNNVEAARNAAAAPLTVSIVCGLCLTVLYVFGTPTMLRALQVQPSLQQASASYIYWRGAIAWAALAQGVALSILLATKDAMTPLKIVGVAAVVNVIGDYLLCVRPLQWGCAGAGAATAFATVFSSLFMLRSLKRKNLLPAITQFPTKAEWSGLLEYTGPLLAITLTRLLGFLSMQRTAMKLGVTSLASYQLCINALSFFLLFGEPLSQLSQTQLPALMKKNNDEDVKQETTTKVLRETLKSILTLALLTALSVGVLPYLFLTYGSHFFSTDVAVQYLTRTTAPSVFVAVVTAILTVTIDGAMLASRDFGFMLTNGIVSFLIQTQILLPRCHSLTAIFGTFTFRLGSYALIASLRSFVLKKGTLGKLLKVPKKKKKVA